jgi:hypothetical protein
MNPTEFIYFVVLMGIVVSAPYLPTSLLLWLDHLVIRIAVIVILLYTMNLGYSVGLFVFLAIAILFLERNRRKVEVALQALDAMEVPVHPQATVEEAHTEQTTVPVRLFDTPDTEEVAYLPQAEHASAEFEPVAPSLNQKSVLATIYATGSAAASQHFYEQMGFGHIL